MRTQLSLRFVLILLLTAAATIALLTMFEAMIRTQLSFGTALSVVLPLLVASRSCGSAWVTHNHAPAGVKPVLTYGAWFALLALIIYLLHGITLRLWSGQNPAETARMLANRPLMLLSVAILAYATCALITCTGFALGARASPPAAAQLKRAAGFPAAPSSQSLKLTRPTAPRSADHLHAAPRAGSTCAPPLSPRTNGLADR